MTAVELRRYVIPSQKGEGWAIIVIGSDGYFSTVSDYGNYAYRWTNPGCEFRKFLVGVNAGYLIGKLHGRPDEYDGDETTKAIREEIVRRRRDGTWTREEAREEWNLTSGLDSIVDFAFWWQKTRIEDAHEFQRNSVPSEVVAFANRAWPRFVEMLKAELAAEAAKKVGAA